jgi:hypothetical protein
MKAAGEPAVLSLNLGVQAAKVPGEETESPSLPAA